MALNQTQINNAQFIFNYFTSRGWTAQAVCGMLGNMQEESMLYENIWEGGTSNGTGSGPAYGIVQWDPASKLIDWCNARGLNYKLLDSQCQRIKWEFDNNQQYVARSTYPMTAAQFTKSTQTPAYLANVFLYNYENPGNLNQPVRGINAQAMFTRFVTNGSGSTATYNVMKAISGYTTAADAQNHANAATTVQPGQYYIFKQANGMLNVSHTAGAAGSWINPADNVSSSAKYTVVKAISGYTTAADAQNRNNAATTVQPGVYFIFKEASGMLNVSTVAGSAGSWINPADNNGGATYTVVSGDTLYSIGQKFGVTVAQLQAWNGLGSSTTIYIGPVLPVFLWQHI